MFFPDGSARGGEDTVGYAVADGSDREVGGRRGVAIYVWLTQAPADTLLRSGTRDDGGLS